MNAPQFHLSGFQPIRIEKQLDIQRSVIICIVLYYSRTANRSECSGELCKAMKAIKKMKLIYRHFMIKQKTHKYCS